MPEWVGIKDVLTATPVIALFVLGLLAYWKGLPAWKEIQLARISLEKDQLEVRRIEAASVGSLTEIFRSASEATEELKIFLRAAMRQHDLTEQRVAALEARVSDLTGMRTRS